MFWQFVLFIVLPFNCSLVWSTFVSLTAVSKVKVELWTSTTWRFQVLEASHNWCCAALCRLLKCCFWSSIFHVGVLVTTCLGPLVLSADGSSYWHPRCFLLCDKLTEYDLNLIGWNCIYSFCRSKSSEPHPHILPIYTCFTFSQDYHEHLHRTMPVHEHVNNN